MIRCKCGGTTFVKSLASKGDSIYQDEMNIQTRVRYCATCLEKIHTTERLTSEVQAERLRLYTLERFAVKEAA